VKRQVIYIGAAIVGIAAALYKAQDIRAALSTVGPQWRNVHPSVRVAGLAVLDEANAAFEADGLKVGVFSAFRTLEEQARYMKRGTSYVNAPAASYHVWGLALDFVFIDRLGRWTWLEDQPGKGMDKWRRLGAIIERHGFEWGGRWEKFDGPHGQMPLVRVASLRAAYSNPLDYIATFTEA
jgi:hypothetical protein